ncbi:MAG: hypothetical protein IPP35_04980 [Elusimicrobia bacterium]|nr:hypothetical protein [Elusimicrobiota bacterium]
MKPGGVWAGYLLSLAWVGLLFFYVQRYGVSIQTESFRREGRRLAAAWSDRLGDGGADRARLLRRLAGDPDSRSAALLDPHGQVLRLEGDPLPAPPLRLSAPVDRSLETGAWAFWAPVWMDGRLTGALAWVRDAGELRRSRVHHRRALLAAWSWWAAVGAIGAAALTRRRGASLSPPPSSAFPRKSSP